MTNIISQNSDSQKSEAPTSRWNIGAGRTMPRSGGNFYTLTIFDKLCPVRRLSNCQNVSWHFLTTLVVFWRGLFVLAHCAVCVQRWIHRNHGNDRHDKKPRESGVQTTSFPLARNVLGNLWGISLQIEIRVLAKSEKRWLCRSGWTVTTFYRKLSWQWITAYDVVWRFMMFYEACQSDRVLNFGLHKMVAQMGAQQ